MLRMEIALILVLGFVAYIYYSAERTQTALHRTFSALLAAALVHLVFDVLTLYTVNHLDTVPRLLNDALHRVFVGTMVLVVFLFCMDAFPVPREQSHAQQKIKRHADIADIRVNPIGVVAERRYRIVDRQHQHARLRSRQKYARR